MAGISNVPRQWNCRVCGFDRYHRVAVKRKNGTRYETEFFACSGCSVMFVNDRQFDVNSTANPSIAMPPIVTPLRRSKARGTNPGARQSATRKLRVPSWQGR